MKPEDIIRIKDLLPTSLGSEEIREQIAGDILRRSVFSARMASASYLAKIREVCTKVSSGEINAADARAQLLTVLGQMGHSPLDEGGLTNPASIRRLNLIIDTQTQMASSVARLSEQTEATVNLFPAWELTRLESRAVPRQDWMARWTAAGESVGFEGALQRRFIALKSSPIWQALGNGAGGYRDTLGNPYPPFAYSSGMDWADVSREECAKLGLAVPGEAETPTGTVSLSPGEQDIADAIERYGFPNIAEGVL
ncbi:MAG: hypothetical protein ACI4TC_09435 [Kiritimatiellia bacterium]